VNELINLKTVRTDVIGSLLRPEKLKQARRRFDGGEISHEHFRAIEDEAVLEALRLQEAVGLDVVTDGEMRRLNFQDSFAASVEGFDAPHSTLKIYEGRVEGATPLQRWDIKELHDTDTAILYRRQAKARLRLGFNAPLDEFSFVHEWAKKPAKASLVGPDCISQRFDYQASTAVYRDIDDFLADVIAIEREMIESVVADGCRYVHIDAPGFTAYVDPPSLDQMRARGEDPMANFARSLKAEAAVVKNLGDGVTTGIHLCRGNQGSMWHREGCDAIAERLFTELPHDRFLLEYDSPSAGSFEPLRFVPKGKVVVLGLISTKVSALETVEDLKRRIDEAAKFIPLDQLAISPQCGFASNVVGNLLSEDDQKRKLERVVETARRLWG
jgi:5-methyltetrahydropteroyltriglutamate--homocysteine methyltransferase